MTKLESVRRPLVLVTLGGDRYPITGWASGGDTGLRELAVAQHPSLGTAAEFEFFLDSDDAEATTTTTTITPRRQLLRQCAALEEDGDEAEQEELVLTLVWADGSEAKLARAAVVREASAATTEQRLVELIVEHKLALGEVPQRALYADAVWTALLDVDESLDLDAGLACIETQRRERREREQKKRLGGRRDSILGRCFRT